MANQKYFFLHDTPALYAVLLTKSMSQYAEELSLLHNVPKQVLNGCIRIQGQ